MAANESSTFITTLAVYFNEDGSNALYVIGADLNSSALGTDADATADPEAVETRLSVQEKIKSIVDINLAIATGLRGVSNKDS